MQSTSYLDSYALIDLNLGKIHYKNDTATLQGQMICGTALEPHPKEPQIRAFHSQWAIHFDLCPLSTVEMLAFWTLWTDCVRHLPAPVAGIISDYSLFFTILDDVVESFCGDSEQPEAHAKQALNAILHIWKTGQIPSLKGIRYRKIESLCAALVDIRQRIVWAANTDDLTLLIQGFQAYKKGVIQQIYLSRMHYPMSRETHIYNRQLNVADPTVILLGLITSIDLGPTLDRHPLLERSHIAICRLGGIINDIIAFPKAILAAEQDRPFQNLIAADHGELLASAPNHGNPLAAAILRTFNLHNLEMREVFRLHYLICHDDRALSAYFTLSVAMLRSWMSWCLNSPRYRAALKPDRPHVREMVQPAWALYDIDRFGASPLSLVA